MSVVSVRVMSFGSLIPWLHAGVSSRAVGNWSLVIPISTLYASPAKIASDLFCAFQPKRVIVPSFPLRLGMPPIPIGPRRAAVAAELARMV